MQRKIDEIVDRVLQRCCAASNSTSSELDEDVRTCHVTLHMDSNESILQFLGLCKQKYPKSIYFVELSAILNGRLGQHEASLYDCNIGLDIDPNYDELLYQKAVSLNMLAKDLYEVIEAYRVFLVVAPEDHRQVLESYYVMTSCYLVHDTDDDSTAIAKETYEQGEEAEKRQLACFLPYESILSAKQYESYLWNFPSTSCRSFTLCSLTTLL